MTGTDLKFFTNEPERDLYSRFSAILKSNTQFFDVLVGYFRTSGFFKMYEALESVDKIRILVGLNVDRFTVKILDRMQQETKYTAVSTAEGKEAVGEDVEKEFEEAPTSEEVEKGVRIFIDWLKSGKLEMRMYTLAPIHAKVYIMRKDPVKVPDTFGSVITGSSNFSEAGLVNNLEFNVELKDAPDVKFALKKFEELWDKAIDIRETYIESVEQRTWLRSDITPYQLYLKTLYEFFKEEINTDKENFETLLPEGYMRLQYQIDAVTQARQKLDAYNGVFISDVVGLGKTYICAMLANTFNRNTYKLFVCPPVLVDYWRSVLQEFDVARCDVESLGKLDKIIAKGTDKYSYVFVDEAHRFRNSDTESFTLLHQICKDKKRNAMPGRMGDFVRATAKHAFFTKVNFSNTRFTYDLIAAQMTLLYLNRNNGICNIKDRDLNSMYEEHRTFDESSADAKAIIKILDYLNTMFPTKAPELKRYSVISLFILIMDLMPNYDIRNRENDIAQWFIDFEANRAQDELKPAEDQDPKLVIYHERVSNSSDTMDSLTYRHNFLKESLFTNVANLPQKDPKRNFDEAQRQVIFRRDKGICRVCGKQCDWNDWEADHIIPWSKGGKTEIENGQVLCPSCNSKKSDN